VVVVVVNYVNFPTNHWRIKCPLYVYKTFYGSMLACFAQWMVWDKEEDRV
jgi:hypothetical protein